MNTDQNYDPEMSGPVRIIWRAVFVLFLMSVCLTQVMAAPPYRGRHRHRPSRPGFPAYPPVGVYLDLQSQYGSNYGTAGWVPSGSATFSIIPSPMLVVPLREYSVPHNRMVIPRSPVHQEWHNSEPAIQAPPDHGSFGPADANDGDGVPLPPSGMRLRLPKRTGSYESPTPAAGEQDSEANRGGIQSGVSRRSLPPWTTRP